MGSRGTSPGGPSCVRTAVGREGTGARQSRSTDRLRRRPAGDDLSRSAPQAGRGTARYRRHHELFLDGGVTAVAQSPANRPRWPAHVRASTKTQLPLSQTSAVTKVMSRPPRPRAAAAGGAANGGCISSFECGTRGRTVGGTAPPTRRPSHYTPNSSSSRTPANSANKKRTALRRVRYPLPQAPVSGRTPYRSARPCRSNLTVDRMLVRTFGVVRR